MRHDELARAGRRGGASAAQFTWGAALVTALLALCPAQSGAQKPVERRVVPVRANLSTPGNSRLAPAAVLARLRVPPGFRVSVWAEGLGSPRMLAVGEDGTVYVTRRDSNDVLALRDDGSGRAAAPRKVLTNLAQVHGIALRGGQAYLATVKEVYVAPVQPDGGLGAPRAIITDLPDGGQHPNRTLGFGPDGMLYISVGSTCNQCRETNDEAATMLRARPDGTARGVHARGLRNTIGWAFHPETGELWGMDHGSDWKGDDAPPEELNRIVGGAHYGWPYCYADRRADSTYSGAPTGGTPEQFCPRTGAPVLTYTAHAAPLQLAFYTAAQFPAEYRGDMLVAMRGSWNREPPSGYRVVRVRYQDGRPTRVEDFLTGFLAPDNSAYHARLAGLAVARDGALLVGDDTNGAIYRVAYAGGAGEARPAADPAPAPSSTSSTSSTSSLAAAAGRPPRVRKTP